MSDLTQRVPIRLVQENGNRIDLDVHTMDMVVHRVFSAFPIPFTGGFNAGVDVNQASVEIELQGVFVDEPGQAESAKASATIEFGGDTPPFSPPDSGSGQGGAPETFPPLSNGSSSGFRIGGSAFNLFGQRPVIPTSPPTTEDEGQTNYLARLHNAFFDLPLAYRLSEGTFSTPPNGNYVRFVFDTKRSGSVKEPFAYPNMQRTTDIVVASNTLTANSDGTLRVLISSGDPRTWFETPDDIASNAFQIIVGGTVFGTVKSVAISSIDFFPVSGITAGQTPSGTVEIKPRGILLFPYDRTKDPPVVVIPVKHMFDENPPNFADGSARSVGTASVPAEVLAYIVSQAISSTTAATVGVISDFDLVAGSGQLSDAFTTELVTAGSGFDTTVKITQKFAFDMENRGEIYTRIPANIQPVINPFTGGKTGNKVKSAGDKVQDILGIVANSQNYIQNNNGTIIGEALDHVNGFVEWMEQRPTEVTGTGDYIIGIQIPYDSKVTLGLHALDNSLAQRNFFTTFGDAKSNEKTAVANNIHASVDFNPSARKHRTNGIKAVVTDFVTMHDAQERLYNFSMKLIAVDSLL